jgi:hypothetical protein
MNDPSFKPLRRVVVVTIALAVFVCLALSQTTSVDDVQVPAHHHHQSGVGVVHSVKGDREHVVSVKRPSSAAHAVAAAAHAPDAAIGGAEHGDASTLMSPAKEPMCPALARVRARVLSKSLRWTADADVVAAVRKVEQPPVDGVVAAGEEAPTFPPHEVAAPVLGSLAGSESVEDLATKAELEEIRAECSAAPDPARLLKQPVVFKRFSRTEAHQCLAGKYVLFYGNSNTRTLYTALEALLRGTRQVGRVLAKQRCDNSKKNHSCAVTVEAPAQDGGGSVSPAPVRLFYWGYVKDFFSTALADKMKKQFGMADIVVGNSGVNVIQGTPDGQWEAGYSDAQSEKLQRFYGSFTKPGSSIWWHTTTRLCEHQKHFTKYKYNPKYWSGRSLPAMNAAVASSNALATKRLAEMTKPQVGVVDGAALVSPERAAASGLDICPHYDDPLHHRFLDRELVQIFLNAWCQ